MIGTAFQKILGAIYHKHHGTANAVAMHPVLNFNRPAIAERLGLTAAYAGELSAALNTPENLTALGVNNPDLDHLTAEALKDPSVGDNPVAMTAENTRALFEARL